MTLHVDYVVVGALARVDRAERARAVAALCELEGVSTFELADDDQLGVLVEASSIDQAHARVVDEIRHVPGVLGVWPVSMEMDGPDRESDQARGTN